MDLNEAPHGSRRAEVETAVSDIQNSERFVTFRLKDAIGLARTLTAERDELQRRLSQILDRLPEGGVWCYACNRATVPVWGEEPYEHIPLEYKQMKTTFRCSICKRETHAKDSCVDSLRAIAEGRRNG